MICDHFVGHNCRGVGVNEHNLHALFLQRAACLCTGIIKFRRLTNNNWPGTDDDNFFNALVFHLRAPPISETKRSNKNAVSFGPGAASG